MKILLRPNLEKKDSVACTNKTIEMLLALSAVPMLDDSFAPFIKKQTGCVFGSFFELLDSCDVLMPIGGDGTILHAAKHAIQVDKPLIGINTGRVGFLTQIEGWELERLSLLIQGKYSVEERMMLEAEIDNAGNKQTYHALNDIILTRDKHRLTEFGVYREERLVVQHRADALIFATPTGSTGYSLSAGGSVIDPSFSAILMTAVCPMTTYNRSLVLPPERTYKVILKEENKDVMNVLVDGEEVCAVEEAGALYIKQSDSKVKLIDLGIRDFYSNLRAKLLLRR